MTGRRLSRRCEFTAHPIEDAACLPGRSLQLRELLGSALSTRAPLVNLVGPPKIGRTSFLLCLRAIARASGRGTEHAGLFGPRQRLVTPLVDLGHRLEGTTIGTTIARAIVGEMREHGLPTPRDELLGDPAAVERLLPSMTEAGNNTVFLLLVDRAEYVPVTEAERAGDEWGGRAIEVVGTLNEALPSFGVVLSFGASGPVAELDAKARELREEQFLLTISKLLDLVVDWIELGLLEREELIEFARRAALPLPGERTAKLDPAEAEWIADLAGGHPFVLQRAGLLASRLKFNDSRIRTRLDVESALAGQLRPLVAFALRRLSPCADGLEATARLAARSDGAAVSPELAEALAGEGLAAPVTRSGTGSVQCRILSPVVRAAIAAHLAQPAASAAGAPADAEVPRFSLSTRDADGQVRIVRVTPAEQVLLAALLHASGAVVSRERLLEIAGEDVSQSQLTQRLSVLRKKIRDVLGVPDAIENVYGRGYRVAVEGLVLRGG